LSSILTGSDAHERSVQRKIGSGFQATLKRQWEKNRHHQVPEEISGHLRKAWKSILPYSREKRRSASVRVR
jgi:hypothetical protein